MKPHKPKRPSAAHRQFAPCSLKTALRNGGPVTRLSCLVMGLGNLCAGQIVKGLCFLAVQAGMLLYLFPGGGLKWLRLLSSLGEVPMHREWNNDKGVYEYVMGDNSQQILLYAVATIAALALFLVIWRASVRSGYIALSIKKAGSRVPTFRDDLRALGDENIHKALMTPPFLFLLVFTVVPLVYMMLMAFTNYSRVGDHLVLFDWVGLSNFRTLFDSTSALGRQFWRVLGWTLLWAFSATFLNFFLGTFMAMLIERPTTRFKGLWRTVFSLTIAVPQFVSLLVLRSMFRENGAVNTLLQSLGFLEPGVTLPFLTNGTWAKVLLIVVNLWVGIPYTIMQVTGILKNIPHEQYEAARIDGANGVQQFIHITFPYMLFVMTPYIITQFTLNINNFNIIYLLTGGGPSINGASAGHTDLLVTWLYKLSVDRQEYNLGAVIGILTFVVLSTVALITYRSSGSYKNEEGFK